MRTDQRPSGGCHLCGRRLPAEPSGSEAGRVFCSSGCRQVHETLGDHEPPGGEGNGSERVDRPETPDAQQRTFLRVDGMYNVTCEAFLEAVAEARAGVVDARASYVTETVRVDHDPELTGVDELCDALSTLGYRASPRDSATESAGTGDERPRAHGRGSGRELNDTLGFRYAAGVVFGSFMLLPYVVMLYPAQLTAFLDAAGVLPRRTAFSGEGSFMALRIFLVLTAVVLFFTGLPLLRGAYVSLKTRRPNTDLLVAVTVLAAFVYSTIAFLLGRIDVFYDTTIVVTAAVVAAVFYESVAKRRAVDRLTDLTVSRVDEARRYRDDGSTETVPVDDLSPGDRVLVRQGERVPVDGTLEEGDCTVTEAVVTGESLPVRKAAGDPVIGGSVVADGAAVLRVGGGATSSIERLTTAVWDIQSAHHGVQRRADRIAATVLPLVGGVAALAGGLHLVLLGGVAESLLAALTVLVAGSPWALGLSTPLSVGASIEEATERGVVVFDETVFERLLDVDVVVFDKTGTLTTGAMDVIEADAPDDLLAAAAALERRASHPAASAIVTAFAGRPADGDGDVSDFRSYSNGVGGTVAGRDVLVGHLDLFRERGWSVDDRLAARAEEARGFGRLPVVVGRDGAAEGLIVVGDEPRAGWDRAVTRLSERGVDVVVLTGDDEVATDFFARHPHVDHVFAEVPPEGKTATIRRLQASGTVSMVGDGTNDAPALAQSDLGIALGGGTAIASDAADVTIVDDDLGAVETAFDLAGAARRRLRQNGGLALLYNAITIPLAVAGLFNPLFVMGAVALTGGALAANAFRPLVEGSRRRAP